MVRTLARGLTQGGVECHIATTDDNGPGRLEVPYGQPIVDRGVTYWHFRRQSRFYLFSWPLTAWLAENVRNYDVVHIHTLFSYASSPAAYWAWRCKAPFVVRPLGTLGRWGMAHRRPVLKKLSFRLIERNILRAASLIHFTSEQERAEAMDLGLQTRSLVIPNPLPSMPPSCPRGGFRWRYPQLHDRRILLFLSRLDRKKGLDLLLRAFAAVRRTYPDAALVLAGDGDPSLTAELKARAESLGVAGDVVWTGFLQGDRKWEAMADADLFVLPSYSENFGIAVIEAMAAGLPVVISDQVGIHPDVARAGAGVVVRCDPGELSEGIVGALRDERLRGEMVENGMRLVQTKYSLEAVARQLIAAYAELLEPDSISTARMAAGVEESGR